MNQNVIQPKAVARPLICCRCETPAVYVDSDTLRAFCDGHASEALGEIVRVASDGGRQLVVGINAPRITSPVQPAGMGDRRRVARFVRDVAVQRIIEIMGLV